MHYFAQYCEPVFDIFLAFRYVKFTLTTETWLLVPVMGVANMKSVIKTGVWLNSFIRLM